jgi:carbamoylphosphate synthase large subunit
MAGLLMERCKIITESDIESIFGFIDNALTSDKQAVLEGNEENFVEQNSEILAQNFAQIKLTFNKSKFREMVLKILGSMPPNQSGGGREEVVIQGKRSFVRYDLYAIVALLVGVFILFLACLQLNQMLLDTTGQNTVELAKNLQNEITSTISSVPRENLSLLSYVYNVFNHVCSNIEADVKKATMTKATNVIYYTFDNFNAEAMSICSTKQTGVLGMMDGIVKAVVNLGGTSACVIEQQKILYEKYTRDLAFEASKQITTQVMALQNIKNLVVAGLGLGAPAVGYLKYRLTSKPSQQLEMLDNDNNTLARGGKKRSNSIKRRKSKKRSKSKKRKTKRRKLR